MPAVSLGASRGRGPFLFHDWEGLQCSCFHGRGMKSYTSVATSVCGSSRFAGTRFAWASRLRVKFPSRERKFGGAWPPANRSTGSKTTSRPSREPARQVSVSRSLRPMQNSILFHREANGR